MHLLSFALQSLLKTFERSGNFGSQFAFVISPQEVFQ